MPVKKQLVDIINLNADASCLSSKRWLTALSGGKESELFLILNAYVEHDLKVNIGIIGSTLAEIEELNPECIDLINNYPQNFQILIRPFIHSLSILWNDDTFHTNYTLGKRYIENTFKNVLNWYLPPEFALRNSQIFTIRKETEGTFIHPKRIKEDAKEKIPLGLFNLGTLQSEKIKCIQLTENFDSYYLDHIQVFRSEYAFDQEVILGWRDGESPFFLTDSVEREQIFIKNSQKDFDRIFLSEYLKNTNQANLKEYDAYPQNSLLPWLGNFRLYWFLADVKKLEGQFHDLDIEKKVLFLNLLNSDILSSIEKNNVSVLLKDLYGENINPYVIKRCERNLDAEELLFLIKNAPINELDESINKLNARLVKRIKAKNKILKKLLK